MSTQEAEQKKKAIFESMSKKGQERILRRGYENWDPFQEPKDPRELIFSEASRRATALVTAFYASRDNQQESVAMHKELFDLCRGLLKGEPQARMILDFCTWYVGKERET